MSEATCAACGRNGYWVAWDPSTQEDRCLNCLALSRMEARAKHLMTLDLLEGIAAPNDKSPRDA